MANCVEEMGGKNTSGVPPDVCTSAPGGSDTAPPSVRLEPLIFSDPIVAYIYIAIMSLALLIGAGGNLLILSVIGTMRNLQRTGKVFIINLALADLCVAAIADPMCVVAVVKGQRWFDDKQWLCETVAALCLTACFCAFLSLTLASINRFVFICHNPVYDKIFTTRTCILSCFIVWVGAFLFEFPNLVGWGDHYFDPKSHQCIWDRTSSLGYTMFVSLALIFSPLVLMLVCYVLIFRHIYKTKYNLYLFDNKDPFRSRKTMLEALRTSRMLLGIFVVFLVCWTPYGIVLVLDFDDKLSLEVHLFVTMLAHMHSSANCLIYTVTNCNFRSAVCRLLGCGSLALTSESESKSTEIAKISNFRSAPTHTKSNSSNSSAESE